MTLSTFAPHCHSKPLLYLKTQNLFQANFQPEAPFFPLINQRFHPLETFFPLNETKNSSWSNFCSWETPIWPCQHWFRFVIRDRFCSLKPNFVSGVCKTRNHSGTPRNSPELPQTPSKLKNIHKYTSGPGSSSQRQPRRHWMEWTN